MKAVVWHGIGDIRLDDVPEPKIKEPTDAIVRLTASAICGTDLHFIRGTFSGMVPGTILGHEGVGVVEEVGKDVRNLNVGDRVVIPSTIACGVCSYCRAGYYAQCDKANPNGPAAGTRLLRRPQRHRAASTACRPRYARIPFANVGLVKLPDDVSDDQAILISDIFPTGYFGADIADIQARPHGRRVRLRPCRAVRHRQRQAAWARAASSPSTPCPSRLEMARRQGAEVINFDEEDPVETLKRLTGGIGADRAIDAVGVDAVPRPHRPGGEAGRAGSRAVPAASAADRPGAEPAGRQLGSRQRPVAGAEWAVEALAKAGTLSIIGVYPPTDADLPHRPGHEQEPDDPDGQLQPPQVHPAAG